MGRRQERQGGGRPAEPRTRAVAAPVPMGRGARVILTVATVVQTLVLSAAVAGVAPRESRTGLTAETASSAEAAAAMTAALADGGSADEDAAAAQLADADLSPDLPGDATLLGPDYALLPDGTLVEADTARPVTDPELTGTDDSQPDPLDLSGGVRRVPVTVDEVREAQAGLATTEDDDVFVAASVADAEPAATASPSATATASAEPSATAMATASPSATATASPTPSATASPSATAASTPTPSPTPTHTATATASPRATSSPRATATPKPTSTATAEPDDSTPTAAAVQHQGNSYGAYWTVDGDTASIHAEGGATVIEDARFVIDVSEHQHEIDWDKVAASDVEGVIIRIGYGWGADQIDDWAAVNVKACKERGIPFGVYLFSYADTAEKGVYEGNATVDFLKRLEISPSDLTYPVYYDLENWSYKDGSHSAPSDPAVNESIVRSYVATLSAAGYGDVSVYSYTSRLNTALNTSYIHSLVTWAAQYGPTLSFSDFGATSSGRAVKGWQYYSQGHVEGIEGNVDINAFHADPTIVDEDLSKYPEGTTFRLYNPNSGEHLFTMSGTEYNELAHSGWKREGSAWRVPAKSDIPVYRMYNPVAGEHHYTRSSSERDRLVSTGWTYEGIAWQSEQAASGVPVYRLYNPNQAAFNHHYTVSDEERSQLLDTGWEDEGVAWYVSEGR